MLKTNYLKGRTKILVVKPSALGDIVHSLPFLSSIKKSFPDARVHWLASKGLEPLLEGHPMIERLWVINKDQWKKLSMARETAAELRSLFRGLRAEKFDIAVDLQGLLRSGVISRVSGAPVRVGFRDSREGSSVFYTHKVEGGRDIHAIERYMRIASFLGCSTDNVTFVFPPLPSLSTLGLDLPKVYAVIAPSAGKKANRWPAERFGELASMLPVRSLVISGKSDMDVAQKTVAHSKGKAISLAGRTDILQMASVIKGARFFVSNDTGPMHIAAAFGVPVFAVFGPANPSRTGPYGSIHTVLRLDLECSPCYRKTRCDHWRCMEDLTPEYVLKSIKTQMAQLF